MIEDNITAVLKDFLDDMAPLKARQKKHESTIRQYEKELHAVFGTVERHSYVTTLHFETAEEYMDYLLQVGRPAEAELEQRRPEFLAYLRELQKPGGGYAFVRDTYLYRCRGEM